MINVIYTEMLKLKKNKILWLIPIGAIIPAALAFLPAVRFGDSSQITVITSKIWDGMFLNQEMLLSLLMVPTLFSLFMGYLVAREYQENTINQLFSYPIARFKFILGKLFVMLMLVVGVGLLSFLFTLGLGLIYNHEPLGMNLLWKHFQATLIIMVAGFALTPIAAVVSMLGKSIVPAMVLGIAAVVSNIIIFNSKFIDVFPWSISLFLVAKLHHMDEGKGNLLTGIASLALTFIIPLIFAFFYYAKSDVHSGS